jgi:branched-chain amino acid aminotransferase
LTNKRLLTQTTINGRLVKKGNDKISVFDNSLLYAEGLFETILAIDNKIYYLDEHLKRMYKGAKILGLKIPVSRDTLIKWMEKTINAHPDKILKLRMTLTSGESARWVGIQGKQQVILSASTHQLPVKPFKLHVSDFKVDQDSVFRRIKTLSFAIHAAAFNQARVKKCDDAIMLNEKGNIAEVTSANIFWVDNNKIYTPPIGAGCLEGITRKVVIKEAKKNGWLVKEKDISLEKLLKVDEIFISSSLKLVAPVGYVKANGKSFRFKTGEITKQLSKQFLGLVGLNNY